MTHNKIFVDRDNPARDEVLNIMQTAKPFVPKAINYPHDTSWTVERDGKEIEVLVEYGVEEHGCAPSNMSGPPENYDPGSGWVFYINDIAEGDDVAVTLTENEIEKVHSWLEENHDDGFDDYDDY